MPTGTLIRTYDAMLGQHLIDHGIYPDYFRATQPQNWDEIFLTGSNRDSSSSRWASFSFIRNPVYHLGPAHNLADLSSFWAYLANGSEQV